MNSGPNIADEAFRDLRERQSIYSAIDTPGRPFYLRAWVGFFDTRERLTIIVEDVFIISSVGD